MVLLLRGRGLRPIDGGYTPPFCMDFATSCEPSMTAQLGWRDVTGARNQRRSEHLPADGASRGCWDSRGIVVSVVSVWSSSDPAGSCGHKR